MARSLNILQFLFLATGSLTHSVTVAPNPVTGNTTTSTISWTDCSPDPSIALKCANFSIPLDWSKPWGPQINLGIGMIPAANASQRIGYLMTNPGGPGGADIQANGKGDLGLTVTGQYWRSSQLHQYFDIVGPDPRGVASSSPLECDPDLWTTASQTSLFPEDEESYNELVNAWKAAGESCAEKSGERLNHVDTLSVARDFEAIRIALGDEPMTFLGFSYGTQVGLQYAELFPNDIRAMVLDAVLDHTQEEVYMLETESGGYEDTLDQFFLWCARNSSCAFHNTTDFPTKFDNYITAANQNPIPAPQCSNASFDFYPCASTASGYDILTFLQELLIVNRPDNGLGVPGLADMSLLLQLAFEGNDASFFATANTTSPISSDYPYTAVICQDWHHQSLSWPEFQTEMIFANIISPHTRGQGEFWRLQVRCMNWPAPVVNPAHSIAPTFQNLTLKTPVLLVNAFYDPETAYPFSVNLQRQFGERNAVLLSRNGSGHTSWYSMGDTHFAINNYLIDLKVPQPATILQS
ncbi:alpha/beta-hydrolase [Mollisia scopiformis]|uniref:Alpha/beta-hydrolase n=1 Tax=Mollisia scopiformis TaxID=149040 RepID=A0A132B4K6_MOLSC|nr:alpha/beta-hydrolase [Mollisia scopiformis]KUJ06939.1 alpha/beta-hydrolase [Mollisia scopiformis]